MTEQSGTFVVTHIDSDSAIVRDIETAQVLTLSSNPGLESNDVIEATVAPDPPLEVSWQVVSVDDRRSIDVVDSDLAPTTHSQELAADADVGDLVRTERAGTGEIHVIATPQAETERIAQEILEDDETVARAARLEAVRVEVRRSSGGDSDENEESERTGTNDDESEKTDEEGTGVVSVRYLPD